jgi:hypothetical protein
MRACCKASIGETDHRDEIDATDAMDFCEWAGLCELRQALLEKIRHGPITTEEVLAFIAQQAQ